MSDSDIYYYTTSTWYKGNRPMFYDENNFVATKLLKDNYEAIKQEILTHLQNKGDEFTTNYTPFDLGLDGWKTVNFYSYFLKYPVNCKNFPVIDKVVNQIPGMCLAMISVLKPQTTIPPHIGDTDGLVRHHLGIKVPGQLPEVGFQIKNDARSWKEGDVFSFCITHRHMAWNHTNEHRIILMVDTICDDLMDRKYEVAGNTLATMAMKHFARRITLLKKMPHWMTNVVHLTFGWIFRAILFLERTTGIHIKSK